MSFNNYFDNGMGKHNGDNELPSDLRNIKLDPMDPALDSRNDVTRANANFLVSSGQSENASLISGLLLPEVLSQSISLHIDQRYNSENSSAVSTNQQFSSYAGAFVQDSTAAQLPRPGHSYQEYERSTVFASQNISTKTSKLEKSRGSSAASTDYEDHLYKTNLFRFSDNFQTLRGTMDGEDLFGNNSFPGPPTSNLDCYLGPSSLFQDLDDPRGNIDFDNSLTADDKSLNNDLEKYNSCYLDSNNQPSMMQNVCEQADKMNESACNDYATSLECYHMSSVSPFDQQGSSSEDVNFQAIGLWSPDLLQPTLDESEKSSMHQSNPYLLSLDPFVGDYQEPGPSGVGHSAISSRAGELTNSDQRSNWEGCRPTLDSQMSVQSTSFQYGHGPHSSEEEYPSTPNTASCSGESSQSPETESCRAGARKKATQKRNRLKKCAYSLLTPEEKLERKKLLNKECTKRHTERKKEKNERTKQKLLEQQERKQQLPNQEKQINLKIDALCQAMEYFGCSFDPPRRN